MVPGLAPHPRCLGAEMNIDPYPDVRPSRPTEFKQILNMAGRSEDDFSVEFILSKLRQRLSKLPDHEGLIVTVFDRDIVFDVEDRLSDEEMGRVLVRNRYI